MSRHILDELVPLDATRELRKHLSVQQVGKDFANSGMSDDEICRELIGSHKTLHTLDAGFFHPRRLHSTYCVIWYGVPVGSFVTCVRKILRHPEFDTHAKRMGKVVRVAPSHIEYYTRSAVGKINLNW